MNTPYNFPARILLLTLFLLPLLMIDGIAQEENPEVPPSPSLACLQVVDLDFGTLGIGMTASRVINVCNIGEDTVTFHDSTATGGGAYLTWLSDHFSISQKDMDRLKSAVLKKGDCLEITVTFNGADTAGTYYDTGRFWANTRECDDVSQWRARVLDPPMRIDSYDWGVQAVLDTSGGGGSSGHSAMLTLKNQWAFPIRLDSISVTSEDSSFALGTLTVIKPGGVTPPSSSYEIPVLFRPYAPGSYHGTITVYYTDALSGEPGTATGTLTGIGGNLPCVTLEDVHFPVPTTATEGEPETVTFELVSNGGVPATVTGLTLIGADASYFSDLTLVGPNTSFPFTLSSGTSQQISLTYTPVVSGPVTLDAAVQVEGDELADCGARVASIFIGEGNLSVEGKGGQKGGEMLRAIIPNPVNGKCEILYQLGQSGPVTIRIYDGTGKAVVQLLDAAMPAGEHHLQWDASTLPSGLYLITIRSGEVNESRRVQIVR